MADRKKGGVADNGTAAKRRPANGSDDSVASGAAAGAGAPAAKHEAADAKPVDSKKKLLGHEPLAMHDRPLDVRTIITCAIDDIALAALRNHQAERVYCSICDDVIEGSAHSTGLMMWTRGDDVRYDEPPLCAPCASSISVSAWARWQQFSD